MTARDPLAPLAQAYAEVLTALRAMLSTRQDDWIDQAKSPLGSRLHCRLVRQGRLKGSKVARRVLVRRKDLDAFIEAHAVAVGEPPVAVAVGQERAGAHAALQAALQRPSRRKRKP